MVAGLFVILTAVIEENTARVAKTVSSQKLIRLCRLFVAWNADFAQAWIAAKTLNVDVVAALLGLAVSSRTAERL